MGAADFLKDLQGKVVDAATYQLLERNFQLQADNNSILRENNELLQKQLDEQRSVNDKLREQVADLEAQLAQHKASEVTKVEFDEVEGILWKKKPEGGYESKPRCPNCKNHPVMHQFPPGGNLHWMCSACKAVYDYAEPPK